MRCPSCGHSESKVIDSRPNGDTEIRRRRQCLSCGQRFTTYEILEAVPIVVIKKDGSRQFFDRNKIMNGLVKACYKRPVTPDSMKRLINSIEGELRSSSKQEIPTEEIGKMVMQKLKMLDEVAYVRFASVYREFKDVETFMQELEHLKNKENQKY